MICLEIQHQRLFARATKSNRRAKATSLKEKLDSIAVSENPISSANQDHDEGDEGEKEDKDDEVDQAASKRSHRKKQKPWRASSSLELKDEDILQIFKPDSSISALEVQEREAKLRRDQEKHDLEMQILKVKLAKAEGKLKKRHRHRHTDSSCDKGDSEV